MDAVCLGSPGVPPADATAIEKLTAEIWKILTMPPEKTTRPPPTGPRIKIVGRGLPPRAPIVLGRASPLP